jgi:glycosyltransferase involved in cell wall biosynthesis
MNILWVKNGKLLPADAGGKIRTYNILRYLSSRHQVTLLSSYGGKPDADYEKELTRVLPNSISICTRSPEDSDSFLTQLSHYLARLFSPAPYAVEKFTSRGLRRLVEQKLNSQQFDVAVCDFLAVSRNFPTILKIPTVLFEHNFETLIWQRQAECEPNIFKKLVSKLEAAKMKRYEAAALRRFHHVIAVSEWDRKLMSREADSRNISVVPTGVDLRQFQMAKAFEPPSREVVFLGSMDWEANVDAVVYFCQKIWPLILSRVPDAKFRIVGRNPHPNVKRLACQSVEVTGTVPSVIEYLRTASAVVVPLRIGGGTRLKIFEAMAMGKLVVATAIGAEGLDVHDGEDIILAEDPEEFAGRVVEALTDDALRGRVGRAAALTASKYDWSNVAPLFENILTQVAGLSPSVQTVRESELA